MSGRTFGSEALELAGHDSIRSSGVSPYRMRPVMVLDHTLMTTRSNGRISKML
jgi:hypothetical protein